MHMIQISEARRAQDPHVDGQAGHHRGRAARRRKGRRMFRAQLYVRLGEACRASAMKCSRARRARRSTSTRRACCTLNGTVLDYDTTLISQGLRLQQPEREIDLRLWKLLRGLKKVEVRACEV